MINIETLFASALNRIGNYVSFILNSTLYTSIFILIIMLLIVISIRGKSNLEIPVKPFIYAFLAIYTTMFLHDARLLSVAKKSVNDEITDEIVGGMKDFRNRETNIYKALHGLDNSQNLYDSDHDSETPDAIPDAIPENQNDSV